MSTTEITGVPAGTWSVDKVHSSIGFAVDYMAGTFTGSFADVEATLAGGTLTVTGDITIKGHTEPIQISGVISDPIADPYGGERFGLKLEAVVDRGAFGVRWNNPLPSGDPALSTKVVIVADLQLARRA